MIRKLASLAGLLVSLCFFSVCGPKRPQAVIICAGDAAPAERLAAAELRRYFCLRTGTLLPVRQQNAGPDAVRTVLFVGSKNEPWLTSVLDEKSRSLASNLGPEEYLIRTVSSAGRTTVVVAGGDPAGVLYGAYRYVEAALGVRFYLHGDVVPDKKMDFLIPTVEAQGKPLFPIRGIQPFHDFPEGPDWWNADEYKAVLAQLPKLGMNFFGLHTYPEGNPNAEPTVWIGMPSEVGENGRVSAGYPSSWQNTLRGNWGYEPKKTSDFHCGAAGLFDEDAFGPEVMKGMMPEPKTPAEVVTFFDRAGSMIGDVFAFARSLHVKTCLGTETPLTVPAWVHTRLKAIGRDSQDPRTVKEVYKGMFERLERTSAPDYYWFWTTESWTWSDASRDQVKAVARDLDLAVQAAKELNDPFKLATCGWVLGPPSDRSLFDRILPKNVTVSCINREVGKAPVDVNFTRISARSKWAIPWLEDDPSLTSPQLWAGRMRRDAADALAYGCDGLLGIHWRTRILSPNVSALAKAAWEQSSWNPQPVDPAEADGPVNGVYAAVPAERIVGADEREVYRDVRDKVFAYHLAVPRGKYNLTLKFCEPEMDRRGARVFDVLVEGRKLIEKLDIFEAAGRFTKLDFTFLSVEVKDGRLDIEFSDRVHYPCIAGIVVQGNGLSRKINCGGPSVLGYAADWPETPRSSPIGDFYEDWGRTQFGDEAGSEIGALFSKLDGRLPIPVNWAGGPGGLNPNPKPWSDVSKDYAFVDTLAGFRPKVFGRGDLERFDYWLGNFRYMREVARLDCLAAEYARTLDAIKKLPDDASRGQRAKETLLPLRVKIVDSVKTIFGYLLQTVSNTGELGTVVNWEQHILPALLEKPGLELEALLGYKLPPEAELPQTYAGPARLFILTTRTSARLGEILPLRVMVLSQNPPEEAFLHWRPMGRGSYARIALTHIGRGVYKVLLPAANEDIEYYVKARVDGQELSFPASAPELNQTVVVMK